MVVHAINPNTQEAEAEGSLEFKTSLVFIVSSRTAKNKIHVLHLINSGNWIAQCKQFQCTFLPALKSVDIQAMFGVDVSWNLFNMH